MLVLVKKEKGNENGKKKKQAHRAGGQTHPAKTFGKIPRVSRVSQIWEFLNQKGSSSAGVTTEGREGK